VDEIRRHHPPDVLLDERHVDANGVEVVPTPGHSPGSTCYVVVGAGGRRYLFTGDTLYRSSDGTWAAGLIPGTSDPVGLATSLDVLASTAPDLVISSAFAGEQGVHAMGPGDFARCLEEARRSMGSAIGA
jgi:hydroxyacylglutathione hydrolase